MSSELQPKNEASDPAVSQLADAISRLSLVMERLHPSLSSARDANNLRKVLPPAHIIQDLLNKSPIGPLLSDYTINDVLINGPFEIYVDRDGLLEKTDITFPSHDALFELAEGIVRSLGRTIDPRRPLIDTRLHDGSRVNIICPPMSLAGLVMSIRKFPQHEITLDTLIEQGVITLQIARFLALCARTRMNVLISGSTGAGKTTLLNAMSKYIPTHERIVTIEDTAELRLQQPHVVRLETKEPESVDNIADEVSSRDLIRNALRMRPDRIIIGEVRGKEAYDMIQAMNTGHDGSMATIHANTPRDALTRLENMLSATMPGTPVYNIRRQIVSTVNIVIQVSRAIETGSRRKVLSISEIVGMEGETPTMQDIFSLKNQSARPGENDYVFEWSGVIPRHSRLANAVRAEGVFTTR